MTESGTPHALPTWADQMKALERGEISGAADLGGIRIRAGIVSDSETIPAQKPIPCLRFARQDPPKTSSSPACTVDRVGGGIHHPFKSSSTVVLGFRPGHVAPSRLAPANSGARRAEMAAVTFSGPPATPCKRWWRSPVVHGRND